MGMNLWGGSPLSEDLTSTMLTILKTSRRQGQHREGLSEGSRSAKRRADGQESDTRLSRRVEWAPDHEDQGSAIDLTAGGLLGSFTSPDVPGTRSVRSFTPVGSITLSPNTSYWFLLGSSTDGTYVWSYVEGSAYTGLGSIRQENSVADSQDSGLNWNYHALTSHPYFFQVNVNPVPVPAAVWFFGSALGLMGMKRRKATV